MQNLNLTVSCNTHTILFIENLLLWHLLLEKITLAKCTQNTIIGVILKDDSLRHVTFFHTDTLSVKYTQYYKFYKIIAMYNCVVFFSRHTSIFYLGHLVYKLTTTYSTFIIFFRALWNAVVIPQQITSFIDLKKNLQKKTECVGSTDLFMFNVYLVYM